MNVEQLRTYCLLKKGTVEAFPFGEDTLTFKVGGKIYVIINLNENNRFNAKCDPERAVELRELYEEVIPGWHMNKKHWNTIYMDGRLSLAILHEILDHSYELVVNSLPKKIRQQLSGE